MWIAYIVLAITMAVGAGAYAIAPPIQQDMVVQKSHTVGESTAAVARGLRRAYLDNPALFPATPQPSGQAVPIPRAVVEAFGTMAGGYATKPDVEFWLDSSGAIFPVDRATLSRDPMLSEAAFNRVGPLTAPKTNHRPSEDSPEDEWHNTVIGADR
jgi:hypothetical protein